MSFSPYQNYKSSQVEWLAEVPEHWEIRAIGDISSLKGRLGWQGLKADEYTDEGPYVVSSAHFADHRVQWDQCPKVSQDRYDIDVNIQLSEGDVLLMKDGAAMGKLAFIDRLPGAACLNSHLLLFRPTLVSGEPAYHPEFLFYYMQSSLFQEHITVRGTGATFLGVSQETIGRYRLALPPLDEQKAIAAFLNSETGKIDALVEEQRRLIELLKEKRQTVISHAVTKGLDPNAKMKPSGVEWLGEVPESWDVMPIRYVARLESGHTPSRSRPDWWENCTVPWFTLADIWQVRKEGRSIITETSELVSELGLANSSARVLPKGTVMLSRTASVGFAAIMGVDMATTQDFANWICGPQLNNEFLLWTFRGMRPEFSRLMMGSTHNTIYMPDIASFRFALPSLEVQRAVNAHLATQTGKIDALITEAETAEVLLLERRAALISAAVTGKIDVREFAEAKTVAA